MFDGNYAVRLLMDRYKMLEGSTGAIRKQRDKAVDDYRDKQRKYDSMRFTLIEVYEAIRTLDPAAVTEIDHYSIWDDDEEGR